MLTADLVRARRQGSELVVPPLSPKQRPRALALAGAFLSLAEANLGATRADLEEAFAQVEVILPERSAVMVPSFTLVPELRGQKVFLYRGGKAEARPVQTGVRTEERVEIVDGLAPGDTLITSGLLQLKPGAPVTIATE